MNIPNNLSALYLSHGGGPLPLLGDEDHQEMVESLIAIAKNIKTPSAMIVISAHWEEDIVTIIHGARPPIIYDYYGFPDEAYEIQYPAPGAPKLAQHIHKTLEANGIPAKLDDQRGFDHGLYVPLKLMYPLADIPCVQVSLVNTLDPMQHIQIGKALSQLDLNDALIIGSGFSFHNMKAFQSSAPNMKDGQNEAFEDWLIEVCSSRKIGEETRMEKLLHWSHAPGARYCHPREEHLLPLHVCYGQAGGPCKAYEELTIIGKKSSFYMW